MALLEIEHLTKRYGGFTAVENISLQVNAGEIVALIGENGAGKTTMLNCIAGSIAMTEGDIKYRGQSLLKKESMRNELSFLIQANFFDYMNAYDNLNVLLQLSGQSDQKTNNRKIIDLLALVGLGEKKKHYVKSFSFGMKQRLGLAQALILQPHFLVLDEPFVGLDPTGKEILKKIIRDKAKDEKAGILFSSHDLEDVLELCDRVVMIRKGKIIYDDQFRPVKRYLIQLNCEENAVRLLEGAVNRNQEAVRNNNAQIICANFDIFQKIYLEALKENICVKGIEIKEDSLYNFFKEESV